MIYLDNAATTCVKPPQVIEALTFALTHFGGVGRGVHAASLAAGEAVFEAREEIGKLLGAPAASRVAFTANATHALNIAISGLLPAKKRALTTAASHNSVLRPLFKKRDEAGCTIDIAPINDDGSLDFEEYWRLLGEGPSLVVATHASNLTGDIYNIAAMAAAAHAAGATFVLDAAQTAGAYPLNMAELGVDVVCFTGHKSLLGPQGTGGIVVASDIDIEPFMEGGSGFHSYDERHPRMMPESLEAGTINAHGLAGLAAGVRYINEELGGPAGVHARVCALAQRFEEGVRELEGVRVYGRHAEHDRGGIVTLNVGECDSAEIADLLAQRFDIATRAGAHCAPLMHRALGTETQGAVRVSFAASNTEDDVETALSALREIAADVAGKRS